MKILILLFLPFFLSAQIYENRAPGGVFKTRPTYPTEDINKTGLIIVEKGMYGLTFQDERLSPETKTKVQTFFSQYFRGYTELKTYRLRVERTSKGWLIEGYLIQ